MGVNLKKKLSVFFKIFKELIKGKEGQDEIVLVLGVTFLKYWCKKIVSQKYLGDYFECLIHVEIKLYLL